MSIVVNNAEDTSLTNHPDGADANEYPQQPASRAKAHDDCSTPKKPVIETLQKSPNECEEKIEPSSEEASTNGDEKDDFPEGGLRGWSVVVGSFCGSFSVFGIINSTGIFQEYFSTHQLKSHSPSQIGWIWSLSLFLTFFCGVLIGPVFDSKGPRVLVLGGSILLTTSMMLLGLCTKYWHFILVYSVLNGLGGCLMNTPALASIGHFFLVRRGTATGVAMTSGSVGGVIFPLMLQKLIPEVGFAWATRILGFILIALLVIANLLIRSRLPRKKIENFSSILPDLTILLDLKFTALTLGIFLLEWGLFIPLTYITSYAVAHGESTAFSVQILAILNAGSFVGRILAGFIADILGRVNTLILTVLMCVIVTLGLWLPAAAINSKALLIVYAFLFGFGSGSNLSLTPVCVGQLCKTENYGRYYATCWMVVAFGTLTGLPIAGAILTANDGKYYGLIIFCGLSYAAALVSFITSRVLAVGWKLSTVY